MQRVRVYEIGQYGSELCPTLSVVCLRCILQMRCFGSCILSSVCHFTDFIFCSALLDINGGITDCNINLCTSPLYFSLI
jgi:hypothetical protein